MDAQTTLSFWHRLSPRGWLLLALGTFFVALSIQYTLKAVERDSSRSAILRWREQLLSLPDGEDIYQRYAYPNPPVMALILLPVVQWPEALDLPPLFAALTWFWLKVGMTLLAFRWVFRMVEAAGYPFPLWAKALTILLSLRAVAGDLSHGNVNLFILFLVVAGLYRLHQRRDFQGGLLIALAAACKVTPALFFPYLVWKRAWKALLGCVAGVALFFWPGFVPAFFLGWEENLKQVDSWVNQMVEPYLIEGFVTSEHNNQSLPGAVYRLFTDSPSFSTYVNDVYTPTRWHNFVSLDKETVRWLIKGCMLLFALLVVWTCRTPRDGPSPWANPRLAVEYGIIVLGMLLFSERTWKHHCVTFVVPFAVLSYCLAVLWERKGMRLFLIASLSAVVLLTSTTSTSLMGKEGGKLAQVYAAYVLSYFVLLAALAVVLRRGDLAEGAGSASKVDPARRPLAA